MYFILSIIFAYICAHESAYLRNIRQITLPSHGFERAGEAYFSPDGKTLIFQAVPGGAKGYQIYTISTSG